MNNGQLTMDNDGKDMVEVKMQNAKCKMRNVDNQKNTVKIQKTIDLFNSNFPGDILKSGINNSNELYLEVNLENILELCKFTRDNFEGTLVSLFANDETEIEGKYTIYYIFAVRKDNYFIVLKTLIDKSKPEFHSITNEVHQANLYEREINDMYGIIPKGHPDKRRLVFHENWPLDVHPLRKDFDGKKKLPFEKHPHKFNHIGGTGVFEIPVGPVHAGIIEPGHFRFSVAGEPIINLEAQLYFVHKGTEKLCEGMSIEKAFYVSERISGDETFSNSLAYCQAIEKIAGIKIPERAEYSRVIFAEFERLVSHFGDLSGICIDVAYGFAAQHFGMLRRWTYQIIEEICGSRFERSVNALGGIRKDFVAGKEDKIRETLGKIKKEFTDIIEIIKANSLFIDRVEETGTVSKQLAIDLNVVGPGGRAAGIRTDIRKEFPYSAYGKLNFEIPEHNNGDVNCRINVKIEECVTSIGLILQALDKMPKGEIITPVTKVDPYKFAIGHTESPRGENIHWVMTGENNTIFRYKVRTPSFCNWPAVCYAVRGNIVPDFPLVNKSFNLSYSGNDL